LLAAGILIVIVIILFIPWNTGNLTSNPHPAQSYAEAVQRIETLQAARSQEMNPLCRAQLMTHGSKAAQVVVLVHGYTHCPQQFNELGKRLFDLGSNVLIAPLPHHGLADRMTEDLSQLKAEEVSAYADEMVDIAQGLGDRVVIMGISAGGLTTAWAAQNRSDIDLAVIIAPAFGFQAIPTPLTPAVMNVFLLLPDSYTWWDPAKKLDTLPVYAYPRYSNRGLAQLLRLSFSTQTAARRNPPAAGNLVVVTNGNEPSVNNPLVAEVVANWQNLGAHIKTYEFDAGLKLPHDLIDPNQPNGQIELVYPKLIEMVSQ
jgi:carboxylesterase